ncbi:zinc-binding oxidoreductase-like protein ToxD [Rhizodiscina lignyota]|uniref:Zinc-binding oxidoreductase-like protein ToxD n=1 Tax=Rhizodiscina lignyota TaxID=1504668 RepID=A0A9P4IA86_9PEZI|nr:zinc-binding oxidoreductase-like protein ToxD [Rhizodiscina lignyota]
MKEALVTAGPTVRIVDSPIPQPGPTQVLIKVIVSGSNPKDWKVPEWSPQKFNDTNTGDDIGGIVEKVGDQVFEFRYGDRVAAFHTMRTPGGSYAEYALAEQHTTFHIPKKTSFEEAAAIPLAALTAAVGLYQRMGLPLPWKPATESIPLVIYGAASAVGTYTIQFAVKSNIHPLICVAGRGIAHVEQFIDKSKGDCIIDYRDGDDAVVKGLQDAVAKTGKKLMYAYDAVSEKGSYVNICKVLDPNGGKITVVLPGKKYEEIPKSVEFSMTAVGSVHAEDSDFGNVFSKYIGRALGQGWFKAQPQEVVPGGLGGVEQALKNLKEGKASAVKYVFRIADTEGVKSQL